MNTFYNDMTKRHNCLHECDSTEFDITLESVRFECSKDTGNNKFQSMFVSSFLLWKFC